MISYNPRHWSHFLLHFYKSDILLRLLPMLAVTGVYSFIVAYLEMRFVDPSTSVHLKSVSILHSLLGFAISMLVVFRTNTAYDRWWEGRKHWGALVNNSRNLALKLNSMLPNEDEKNRVFFKQIIPRFALELMNHLQSEETLFLLDEKPHPEIPDFDRTKHVPFQVASLIINRLNLLYRQQMITGEQLIIMNAEATSFMDVCGACERIKNTPIPYAYSGFIKRFIFLYIISLPVGYVFNLGYMVVPVVMFVFYVLASLELIAEEIEEPFGKDSNDLPMQRIADNIHKNIIDILT
jgi:putative membrane protein